jgi:hypothetical protein
MTAPPDEAAARALLIPLLSAVDLLHRESVYHRDIAPDNILIQPGGRPLLLDFGAARRVIGDLQRAPTVILKDGYAPVEQYGDMPELAQGAWTDLYALASVVHRAITGSVPPPSVQRFLIDKHRPLAQTAAGRYGAGFLQAVDRALAVLPKDRPQSADEWRALLGLREQRTVDSEAVRGSTWPEVAPAAAVDPEADTALTRPLPAAAVAAAIAATAPKRAAAPAPARRRAAPGWALAALAAVFFVGIGVYLLPDAGPPAVETALRPEPAQPAADPQADPPPAAGPTPLAVPSRTPAQTVVEMPPPIRTPAPRLVTVAPAPPPPAPSAAAATVPVFSTAAPSPAAEPNTTAAAAPRGPGSRLPANARRCTDVTERVTLGEPLSAEERDFLKQECGG